MTVFERVLQIAEAQRKSVKELCYELEISCSELEQRLNRLDPKVVEPCAKWLQLSYWSFFFSEQDRAKQRLEALRQVLPGLWEWRAKEQ